MKELLQLSWVACVFFDLFCLHEEVQEITEELQEDTGIYDALGCQVRADFPEWWWLSVKMVTGRGTACHTLDALFGMVCSRFSDEKKHFSFVSFFSAMLRRISIVKDWWSSALNLNSGQLSPCHHDAGPTHLSLQVDVGLHSRSSSEIRSHLNFQKKLPNIRKVKQNAILW